MNAPRVLPPARPLAGLLLLAVGCTSTPGALEGRWVLEGADTLGLIEASSGAGCSEESVTVTLYGPALSTNGPVPGVAIEEQPGVVWLWFPLTTALGPAEAALRLQGNEAMLPLGARPGEHELRLARSALDPGQSPDSGALDAARAAATESLDLATAAWRDGAFRMRGSGDELVGEVRLRPDGPPLIAVYDATWWTGGLVEADRFDEGPDLVLTFPVEPAVEGEEGQIRLNVARSAAVVPADAKPTDLDRLLELEPGVVSEQERETAMVRARTRADQAEQAAMVDLGQLLAARARTDDGRCLSWQEVQPALEAVLVGYDLRIEDDDGVCVVDVEPQVSQHRRRLRARIGPEGLRSPPL